MPRESKRRAARRRMDFLLQSSSSSTTTTSSSTAAALPLKKKMPMEMVRALSRAIERNACAEFGLLKIAQFDLDGARVEGEEGGKRLIELAALLDRDIIVHSLLRAGSCISRTPQSSSAATAWQRAQVYPAYVAYVCKGRAAAAEAWS